SPYTTLFRSDGPFDADAGLLSRMGEWLPRFPSGSIGFVEHKQLAIWMINSHHSVGYLANPPDFHEVVRHIKRGINSHGLNFGKESHQGRAKRIKNCTQGIDRGTHFVPLNKRYRRVRNTRAKSQFSNAQVPAPTQLSQLHSNFGHIAP